MNNNLQTKRCALCKQIKTLLKFTKNKRSKDGFTTRCNKCIALKRKEWRDKDPEETYRKQNRKWNLEHKEQQKVYNKKHKQGNSEYYCGKVKSRKAKVRELTSALKNKPCFDCQGWFESCQMDFDHRPETKKLLDITSAVNRSWPLKKLLEEIAKCDIVCANCHRLRTFTRKQHINFPKKLI